MERPEILESSVPKNLIGKTGIEY